MGLFRVVDCKVIGREFDPSSFEMLFSFLEYKVVGKKTKGMLIKNYLVYWFHLMFTLGYIDCPFIFARTCIMIRLMREVDLTIHT